MKRRRKRRRRAGAHLADQASGSKADSTHTHTHRKTATCPSGSVKRYRENIQILVSSQKQAGSPKLWLYLIISHHVYLFSNTALGVCSQHVPLFRINSLSNKHHRLIQLAQRHASHRRGTGGLLLSRNPLDEAQDRLMPLMRRNRPERRDVEGA